MTFPGPRIIDLDQIRAALSLTDAADAVSESFLKTGLVRDLVQPKPMGINLPHGEVHIKSAQMTADGLVVVKIASGFPKNVDLGLPPNDGMMIALHPGTGQLVAILLDHGWLTDVRTAAATAVAVRHLSPARPRRLALLGTGVQASLTLRMLAGLDLLPADVAIWGRTPARAGILAEEAQHMGVAATVVSSAREAVETAELVVTVTAARVPILEGSWLADDALVAAVGADSEGKRECDGVVMSRAGCLIVDSLRQAASVGELQHAQAEDTVPEHIFELGELLALNKPIHEGIRVCDFTGLGMHDAAVANMVLSKVLATAVATQG